MGNLVGDSQKQLTQSLSGQYQLQSHPYLLLRRSNQLCVLHKLTTNSPQQSSKVLSIIDEYTRTKCQSISALNGHYLVDKRGYCSDEETYFLIFRGQNSYTLKEEVTKRRFYQQQFREDEIRQIIQTYLCGLRQYNHRFQRDYQKLSLQSLIIDQPTNHIYLRDPYLNSITQTDHHADTLTHLMQSYPSPQKISAATNPKIQDFSQFLSNLFIVGVMSLELKRLDFADSIYGKREVNFMEIEKRVNQFRDQKLRKGIGLLLRGQPNSRRQIFMIWGIENRQQHFLTPISEDKLHIQVNQVHPQPQILPPNGVSGSMLMNNTYTNQNISYSNMTNSILNNTNPNNDLTATLKRTSAKINMNPHHPQYINYNNNNVLQSYEMKNVESMYIAHGGQGQNRSKTPTNIHFNNGGNSYKAMQLLPPLPNSSGSGYEKKNFISFRDYLVKEEHNTTLPNIANKPSYQPNNNKLQFSRNYSPQPRNNNNNYAPKTTTNNNPQLNKQVTTKSVHQPHKHVFGSFKESFTFNQPPPVTAPLATNSESRQTSSPKREAKRTMSEQLEKDEEKAAAKATKITQESLEIKENTNKPQIRSTNSRQEQSPQHDNKETQRPSSPFKGNQNISQTDTFLLKQTQNPFSSPSSSPTAASHPQKSSTPVKPTSKNKYNSTIIQVKDEDTPDNSAKSDQMLEQQYVVQQYETGSKYQGFKSGGMRNGRGKFYYQDGGYYQGQWKNNKMDGYGKLYYQGGKIAYQGEWAQDQFNGLGKVYNDNPVDFSGSFDYTNFDYLEDYWEYYEGMLHKDTKEGRGRIKLSNGEMFEGDFHEDKIQGFGKFHTCQGKTVEGIWRDSKLLKVISNQ